MATLKPDAGVDPVITTDSFAEKMSHLNQAAELLTEVRVHGGYPMGETMAAGRQLLRRARSHLERAHDLSKAA